MYFKFYQSSLKVGYVFFKIIASFFFIHPQFLRPEWSLAGIIAIFMIPPPISNRQVDKQYYNCMASTLYLLELRTGV